MILEDQYGVGGRGRPRRRPAVSSRRWGLRVDPGPRRQRHGLVHPQRRGGPGRQPTARVWVARGARHRGGRGTDVAHVSELLRQLAVSMHEEDEWADGSSRARGCGASRRSPPTPWCSGWRSDPPRAAGAVARESCAPGSPGCSPARGIRIPAARGLGPHPRRRPTPVPMIMKEYSSWDTSKPHDWRVAGAVADRGSPASCAELGSSRAVSHRW